MAIDQLSSRVLTFEDLFENGIKRSPGEMSYFADRPDGLVLNLGAGRAPMPEPVVNLDLPTWRAPWLADFGDGTVSEIHMYHFLEHLSPDDALTMLRESQRVLGPGGVINLVVPHAMCPLGYQAPDHRTFWTEEGLQDTFYSAGYDTTFGGDPWDMDIVWMMVLGVKWSNLCVAAQIAKRVEGQPYKTPWRRDGNVA